MMMQVNVTEHDEIRYDDGSVERIRVSVRDAHTGRVINTGYGFATIPEALTFADGVYLGLRAALGPGPENAVGFVRSDERSPAPE